MAIPIRHSTIIAKAAVDPGRVRHKPWCFSLSLLMLLM